MSVRAMAWVWEQEINRDEKFVLLAYADHADHQGNNIFPAVATIAQKTGYSERSVQRITRKLVDSGWLVEDGTSKLQTNQYSIPIDGGDKMTPPTDRGDKNAERGDKMTGGGVTNETAGGDIAMSPEPSFNRQLNHQLKAEEGEPTNVIGIIAAATGMVAIPPNELERVEQIASMVDYYGGKQVTDALQKAFGEWKVQKSANGRPYRTTNFGWVDWAQDELARNSQEQAKPTNGRHMIRLPDGTITEAKL